MVGCRYDVVIDQATAERTQSGGLAILPLGPEPADSDGAGPEAWSDGARRWDARFDVVGLSVMTNRMEGVVRKMTNTLFRTARSTVLNTARDFSCCIVTADHQMLVMAESLPIHVISGPDMISRWLRRFHPRPARGFLPGQLAVSRQLHAGDHASSFRGR